MIDHNVLFLLLLILTLAGVAVFCLQWSFGKRLKQQAYVTEAALAEMAKEVAQLRGYLSEPVNKLFEIEQRNKRLTERLEQLELRDKSNKQFGEAASLLSKGTSIEEIMARCGISRGEAELISVMHDLDDDDESLFPDKKIS